MTTLDLNKIMAFQKTCSSTEASSADCVGIDAMNFYTSPYYLDLKALAEGRGVDVDKFYRGLGQEKMAVIPPDQDIVTMAACAAKRVVRHIDPNDIEMLLFATESGVDQSKAAGIYVHRLLNLPSRCRVVELKQACYSATMGLQMALAMLKTMEKNKKILLIASDIAKYGLNTTGESSQGGGAVAMILSSDPRLLVIEQEAGFYTEDVMDFWRPNYREEALVEGKYSCELYLKVLQKTWEQYTLVSGRKFLDHLRFCYHVPVPKLVEKAHQTLFKINGELKPSAEELSEQLEASLLYGRAVGNCYTASLYLSLLSLCENTKFSLANKRIGFYSYGSGCVGEFFSGVLRKNYQEMLDFQFHSQLLQTRTELSLEEYEAFYCHAYPNDGSAVTLSRYHTESHYHTDQYRLAGFKDHKRQYECVNENDEVHENHETHDENEEQ